MIAEVSQQHAYPNYGDFHHTFIEWQRINAYLNTSELTGIETGVDVSKRSNTLDNQQRPHRDWPKDNTMHRNSQSFGDTVVRYINGRGHNFITGSTVPGQTERQSHFQVLTTYKGFPKTPIQK